MSNTDLPAWLNNLMLAHAGADEYLTAPEHALVQALELLLRARHGHTAITRPKSVAKLIIRDALSALDNT